MTLQELRILFIERSGDINITNTKMDNFINQGVKFLDELTDYIHTAAKQYIEIAINSSILNLPSNCRVIDEVWVISATTGRTQLAKVSTAVLRAMYNDFTDIDSGKPVYYTLRIVRANPSDFDPTDFPTYAAYMDTIIADYSAKGITIMPPADTTYLIEVIGKFYSPTLTESYNNNWWSYNHPELVITAALYRLEMSYKNTEGANGYLTAINTEILSIIHDKIDEEQVGMNMMEG